MLWENNLSVATKFLFGMAKMGIVFISFVLVRFEHSGEGALKRCRLRGAHSTVSDHSSHRAGNAWSTHSFRDGHHRHALLALGPQVHWGGSALASLLGLGLCVSFFL